MKRKIFSILFALVLALSLSLITAVPVAAQTNWYVATTGSDTTGDGSSGNPWATIGYAISQATAAGDTINVVAGTYNVTAVINVNLANLTISGASATTTIVDGLGKNASIVDGADVLFNVTASGVTIEDMTIDLGDDTTDFDIGVFTPNGGGIDDLTVQNCTLLYAASGLTPGEQLIHLGGGSGVTITLNAFDVASGNSMIYVGENVAGGDNDLLTVSNNTAAPVAASAGGAGDADGGGTFFNQFGPVTNSTISGNTLTDTGGAVYLGAGSLADTDTVLVTGNTFNSTAAWAILITSEVDGVATGNITVTNNTFTGTQAGGAITIFDTITTTADVDGSTITINNNNFAGDNTGGGVVVGLGVSGTPVDATNNWWGDASGPSGQGTGSGDAVSTNADYIPWLDAEYPGGAATYPVMNSTTSTPYDTIQAAIAAATDGNIISVAAGTFSVTAVINVNVANLTISGASAATTIVDGLGKNASIVDGADVLFNVTASGVTIEDMTIDLGDDTTDFDIGVFTPNGGGIDDLTVQNCTLLYAASGLTPGEQLIHLGGGTGVTITGNAFDVASGNSMIYVGENVAGGDNDLLTVSNNTAAPVAASAGGAGDADGGGTFFNQFGPVTNSTISGNTFTDTGIAVYLGAGSLADTDTVLVTGNTFDSTSGSGSYGALVITSEVDGVATGNIVVTNNTFTGTEAAGAITIFDTITTTADVDGLTITINNNNFAGDNTGGGVVVGTGVSGTPVDATNNWWGDASGPSGQGTGSGDAVSTNADFTPWLDAEYPGGAATHPIVNSTTGTPYDTIQDAVDDASTDDVLTIAPGEYTLDITIDEDITLISSGGAEVTKITGTGGTDPVVTIGDYTVTLEGFEIDPGDEGVYIYDISAGNVVTIENSIIHGNAHQGIWVEGTVYGTLNILNNIIADNDWEGILINEVDDGIVVIKGNVVGAYEDADYDLDGNGYEGIYLEYVYNGSTVTIGGDTHDEANLICENGDEGIYVNKLYYGSTLTIEGNIVGAFAYDGYTFAGNGQNNTYDESKGISIDYVDYGSTVTIRHNAISENYEEGIEIYTVGFCEDETEAEYYALFQTYGANTITIEGNWVGAWEYDGYSFDGNDDYGVYISYANFASNITIQGNTISANDGEGIDLEYLGYYGDGFYLDSSSSDLYVNPAYPDYFGPNVLVRGNTITDNQYGGIYQHDDWEYGTSVTIEGNTISGNKYAGIYSDSYYVEYDAHVTIRGNTITSNGVYGWYGGIYFEYDIEYASSLTIEGNLIAGNFGDGIYIYDIYDKSDLTIRGNTIGAGTDAEGNRHGGNAYTGIYIDYVYWYSTADISRNTIAENADEGIYLDYVYDDSSVSITCNNILDNDSDGIYVYDVYYEDSNVDINYNNIAGNSGDGVYYSCVSSYYQVDATNNWWGDISGPSNYGPGTGDGVSDYVPFSPWLTEPAVWQVKAELTAGWNTFSTPIALDGDYDQMLSELNLDMNTGYEFSSGIWVLINGDNDVVLEPCNAYYVKMNNPATVDLVPNESYSDPPSLTLSAGWNLVSLANLGNMAAEDALASAYLVTGDYTGYSQVVSPEVNGVTWSAVRGPAINTALGYDMLPTEGYWVFMTNAGTLAGFTSTPIQLH